jgi:hypothetical protein
VFEKAQRLRGQIEAGTARAAPTTAAVRRTIDTDEPGAGQARRPNNPDDNIPF